MGRMFLDKKNNKHFDDPSISDDEGFLRRAPKEYWKGGEISSVAFGPEDISFSLESLINPIEFHGEYPDQGLIRLYARQLRGENEVLERAPYGHRKSTLAHALSWGKRPKRLKRKLKEMAEILYKI